MKLVINTQYMENYGAHDWDGKGECPQYWKMKGGSSYVVEDVEYSVRPTDEFFDKKIRDIVDNIIGPKIERNNEYCREYILGYSIEDNGWVSEFEQSQMEYEGFVQFPEPRITIDGDLVPKEIA